MKARKIVKLGRYMRARLRPKSALPFFWHIGRPNFGDDINPRFFEMIDGRKVRLETDRARPHFLGMGSILERATPCSTVLGAGFIQKPDGQAPQVGRVVAVRGQLSREHFNQPNVLLGDPMVLLELLCPHQASRHIEIGFVPHVSEVREAKALRIPGLEIIDPALDPMAVIHKISQCKRVFSQSLHGLIVADALRVPSVWVAPGAKMKGGAFKFHDYFTTLDAPKTPMKFDADALSRTTLKEFHVSNYKFDKREYLEAVQEALHAEAG